MPELRYRTRSESPIVWPFKRLEALESLVERAELVVFDQRTEPHRLIHGSRLKLPPMDLVRAGIRIDLGFDLADLIAAIDDSQVQVEQLVAAVVLREPKGGHLKLSSVAWRGSLRDLPPSIGLTQLNGPRHAVLANGFDGFEVMFIIALGENLEPTPTMPYRAGTVLARAQFAVAPNTGVSGLQPKELTAAIRSENHLRRDVWLWVRRLDELHRSTSLSDVVEVYVDEEILRLSGSQTQRMREVAESLFVIPALVQVVFMLSQDLVADDHFVWDGTGSEVLDVVLDTVKRCGVDLDHAQLVDLLRSDPARIAAIVSGAERQRRRVVEMLTVDSEDEGGLSVVSNS